MKKLIFRVLSYALDMIIISMIVSLICLILPFSNQKKINKIQDDNFEYTSRIMEVIELVDKDGKYMEDSILSKEEYKELSKKYNKEFDKFFKPYIDKELSEEEITNMVSDFSSEGIESINKSYYEVSKLNLPRSIINIIVVVLYFGILQFFLKGQTIGKKLFRLYVVSENNKDISIYSYLIRSILVTTCIFSLGTSLIAINTSYNNYMNVNKYYSFIVQSYSMLMAMFIIFRNDQKGFHDLLLKTRVKMLNKDGSEYTKVLFMDEEEEKVEKKPSTKKKKKNEKNTNKNN